jgi:hypothetical protein
MENPSFMPPLVSWLRRGHRAALGVLLKDRIHYLADRPVVAETDHLRTLGLEDPPHDVDRGVVAVEQRGRADEPAPDALARAGRRGSRDRT